MQQKLNILFLSSWYPSRVSPDSGDFIQRHAEVVTLMHNVTALYVITDRNTKGQIEIVEQNIKGVRTLIAYIKPGGLKIFLFIKAYKMLLIIAGEVDIIHVNKLYPVGMIALYLKYIKGIKYLISEHHHIYYTPFNEKIRFVESFFSKIITKNASYVCPVSDNLGEAMQDFGLKGNYHKIPNVIATDIFKPKIKKQNSKFTLLHVSGVSELKNINGILKVVAELQHHIKDFVFYMIGEGIHKYKEIANHFLIESDKIVFIDQLTQNELANYYQKADVLVMFSQVETFSIVIYEAFSSGTPVISSNIGAIKENFPSNFGLLVEKGNKQQLLDAIIQINTGSIKAEPFEMHEFVVENFSREIIAKEFSNLYNKIHHSKDK